MKKPMFVVVMLTMVAVAIVPASAASWDYGSCADIPTYAEAQQILDDPNYGYVPPLYRTPGNPGVDSLNLDPDGDSTACNDEGNRTGDAQGFVLPVPIDPGPGEVMYPADPSDYFDDSFESPLRYVVDCYWGGLCAVDDYGFALLHDFSKVPVEEVSDGPVLDTYTGNLVRFVEGEPVVVEWAKDLPLPGPDDFLSPVVHVSDLLSNDTAG